MDNAFWHWCVQTKKDAYWCNEEFNGESSPSAGPCWCFQRMGQPKIILPDGRVVWIAGEHEDHYDPDFYIYNDVVIEDGDNIQVFGYPESVFPPTDFHSATLVGSRILLIGNLSYPANRKANHTQVKWLELDTWRICDQPTTGDHSGWIHRHNAVLLPESQIIRVTGGMLAAGEYRENFDDFDLCLQTYRWTKTLERKWQVWELERTDGDVNKLWEISSALWKRLDDPCANSIDGISARQLDQYENLYRSPFDDSRSEEDEDKYGRHRWLVDGIVIRIDEDMMAVKVTVEGELEADKVQLALETLKARLSAVENQEYVYAQIYPQ